MRIEGVEVFVLRAPVEVPVRTSFGAMRDRPAVAVCLRDSDGAVGWGEVWCNFPGCGAEHRGRLVATVLAPLLVGREVGDPVLEWHRLTKATHILALQSGEPGPFAQAIAGIDIALWDLVSRRAGLPLWQLLSGESSGSVPVYASGINPDGAADVVQKKMAEGHRAFKLKVGFGKDIDLANLRTLRQLIGPDLELMADANQGWILPQALSNLPRMQEFGLKWIEEPLAADAPAEEWRTLGETSSIPLAGGENLRGTDAFKEAIEQGVLSFIQPDVAKWGGISGCLAVARHALQGGRIYCPHYLGGGIGLAASAHLLAAAGGPGLLEIDTNDNPLVAGLWPAMPRVENGRLELPDIPGLGAAPDQTALARYQV